MKQKLPAYPIFIKDPYFSFWSNTDVLNESDIINWVGSKKKIYGIIYTDECSYSFLGDVPNCLRLKQTNLEITSFSTKYNFTCDNFDLYVEFISPLPPDDLELLSRPVCMIQYKITLKNTKLHNLKLGVFLHENVSYNQENNHQARIRGDVIKAKNYDIAFLGLDEQKILSHSADVISSDWGYYYLTGENCFFTSEDSVESFIKEGTVKNKNKDLDNYIVSINHSLHSKILVAFDDICSIYYFGELLRGYYFKDGKTIIDAINESYDNFTTIMDKCNKFDEDLRDKASKYGNEYFHILKASLRQSVGAHKLVQDSKGRILFLSKECGSAGCIATVDVSYPSMPLFLIYNPTLVLGMLYPIFDFASMPIWKYDFAPHDAGVYPYCIGQYYGIRNMDEGPYHREIGFIDGKIGVLPFYYQYYDHNIYDYSRQMPVEESGNMLILAALALKMGCDRKKVYPYLGLLKKWADYLMQKGMIPQNQLCTDDFDGHIDKNINLAIKATIALAAFDFIMKEFNYKKKGKKYLEEAKKRVKLISQYKTHIPLTFDSDDSTYSLKYNFVCDKWLDLNLFNQDIIEREVKFYMTKANDFGIPLSNRATHTKSDWMMWVAAMTDNLSTQKKIISFIINYLLKTPVRVPFSDWYDSINAQIPNEEVIFRNRTVQGGLFSLILKDYILSSKNQ